MPDYSQYRSDDLVELAKQGDEFAYAQLYQEYGQRLCTYLRCTLGNEEDAQDITQEAFLTGWQKLRSLRDNRYFKTWLYSIATNEAHKRLLKTRPHLWLSLEEHEQIASGESIDEMSLEEHIITKVLMQRALLYVSPKNRACLLLWIIENLPQREIAELLGIDKSNVSMYIKRGLEQLHKAYSLLEQAQSIPERKEADL